MEQQFQVFPLQSWFSFFKANRENEVSMTHMWQGCGERRETADFTRAVLKVLYRLRTNEPSSALGYRPHAKTVMQANTLSTRMTKGGGKKRRAPIPFVEFLQPTLDRVRVVLPREPLQQEEGLLEHAQQVLLKVHRHAVLGHKLVDAGHGEHAQPSAVHLVAIVLVSVLAPTVCGRRHCAGVELPVRRRRVRGDERSGLGLCPQVAAKPSKVKNGRQQGGRDACWKRDPAEEMSQALQDQAAELMTFIVQRRHGLAEQLWVLAALEQTPQQLNWNQIHQGETCIKK